MGAEARDKTAVLTVLETFFFFKLPGKECFSGHSTNKWKGQGLPGVQDDLTAAHRGEVVLPKG